ncbi:MAG: guanylate kinase [Ilumatobacteraceae bacterium]|jgi:guanylate kinase|nr:guanylate kinase [Ilumatobacteraceae bacterium]MBJ7367301.1 guanylate kinase [Ilumatobacteraceae bacterium]MBJ7488195.1 guanylate kinase [Ilumatobacteraceae bacterium]
MSKPLIIVVSGPGGAGKGTLVDVLLERDTALWLSRSWTTRAQREGEPDDAYVFVSRDQFHRRIGDQGFLEWTEFLGNLYGSPIPDDDIGNDIVLEIELHGAKQVKEQHPEALLVFVMPPSRQEQERRLRERGDPYRHVMQRLKKAESEEREGTALADVVIVNDDLDRAVTELVLAIGVARRSRG